MTPEANLLTGITNISRLCMVHSQADFEVNMSLYPVKNELNIYVYKGGHIHAWRKPEERIEKIRIDLVQPKIAAIKMLEAYRYIEKLAQNRIKLEKV